MVIGNYVTIQGAVASDIDFNTAPAQENIRKFHAGCNGAKTLTCFELHAYYYVNVCEFGIRLERGECESALSTHTVLTLALHNWPTEARW
jgi:hypothetical protein